MTWEPEEKIQPSNHTDGHLGKLNSIRRNQLHNATYETNQV